MRAIYLTLLIITLFIGNALAQIPVINQTNISPVIGSNFTYHVVGYQSPGLSGANQNWDFSNLSASSTDKIEYLAPSTNPASGLFPQATILVKDNAGGGSTFNKNTSSGQTVVGVDAGGTIITYSDPEDFLRFPMTYNDTYTDNFAGTFTSQGIQFYRSGSVTVTADAYGDLTLPFGTVTDALRIHMEENYNDEYTYQGSTNYIYYSTDIYIWYKPGFKTHLFTLSTISSGSNYNEYGFYTDLNTVGIDNIELFTDDIQIYPNPAVNETNLMFNIKNDSELSISVFNLLGRKVIQLNKENFSAGNHKVKLNTSELVKGTYIVALNSENNVIHKKMIVN